jgi:hypothetical protein
MATSSKMARVIALSKSPPARRVEAAPASVDETYSVPETCTVSVSHPKILPPPITGIPKTGIPVIDDIRLPRIRRATKVQDGHSSGEQIVLQLLWNNGTVVPEAPYRRIAIGYKTVSGLSGLALSTCIAALQSLEKKLAIQQEVAATRTKATIYRVYSFEEILKRREEAGLTHIIRRKGAVFVDKTGTPITGIPKTSTPNALTGIPKIGTHQEQTQKEVSKGEPSSSVVASVLQKYLAERPDDDGITALVNKCRAVAPDATGEEIAHFVDLKADQAIRMRSVRNLMGFLLTAVPRALTPAALADLRDCRASQAEAARREEEERQAQFNELVAEQRAVLANPSAPEEDRLFAARFLENVGQA